MKRYFTFAIAAVFGLASCTSTKTAQNISTKETVDNDLYFKEVKLSEQPILASSESQNQNDDGPLTRYYDPNDPDYYYSNRINKFYYPQSYNTYFDDFYNPYHPYSSWSFGIGSYYGNPYYGSSYYWGMPSTYFTMGFGFGSPYYGYGYGYSPYAYNNYLGYYYNYPYYSGGYYPGYIYNVAPNKAYSNYGPRGTSGGTNINRLRAYPRGSGDAYNRPNELGTKRTESTGNRERGSGTEASPRSRTYDGESSRESTRPTYVAPRNDGGSRSTGGERGGSSSGSSRPRSRN